MGREADSGGTALQSVIWKSCKSSISASHAEVTGSVLAIIYLPSPLVLKCFLPCPPILAAAQ